MCAEAGMQPRLGYAASPHLSLVGEGGRKVGSSPGIQNLPGSLDLRAPVPALVGLVEGVVGHVTVCWHDSENLV